MIRTFASLITLTLCVATTVALPDCRLTDDWKIRHQKKDRKCGDLKTKKLQNSLCKKLFKKNAKTKATGFDACPLCKRCAFKLNEPGMLPHGFEVHSPTVYNNNTDVCTKGPDNP